METKVCCICGKEYTEYPNNAHPVAEGECCQHCNWTVVLPERIRLSNEHKKQKR